MKEPQMEDKKRNIFCSPVFIRKFERRINFNWIIGSKTPLEEDLATPSMTENSSATGLVPGREAEYPLRVLTLLQLSKEVAERQ